MVKALVQLVGDGDSGLSVSDVKRTFISYKRNNMH